MGAVGGKYRQRMIPRWQRTEPLEQGCLVGARSPKKPYQGPICIEARIEDATKDDRRGGGLP